MKNFRSGFAALVISAAVAGCGANKGGESQSSSYEPPPSPDAFETAKEPAINPDTRFAAGQLAESRKDFKRAIALYEQTLVEQPDHLRAMNRLGVVLTLTRQPDRAAAVWKRYVQATGGSADAWNNLAQCYDLSGKVMDAEQAYRNGIAVDTNNAMCRTNFGLMLVRIGRIDEGREQLAVVLPTQEVHYNVGSALELSGKPDQARAEYIAALKIDPNFSDAKSRLAALRQSGAIGSTGSP